MDSSSESPYEIFLEETQVEFEVDGLKVVAPARAVLYLRPQPNVVFEVKDVPGALRKAAEAGSSQSGATGSAVKVPILSGGPTAIKLDNGTAVNVISSRLFPVQKDSVLYGCALPCVALDTGRPLYSIKFSVMNFSRRLISPLLYLEVPPWQIAIEPVSDLETLRKTLDFDRGYAVTHHGTISRTDNNLFSVEEATELLDALNAFFSFVCGTFCSPLNAIGLDSNGDEAWKRWGPHYISPWCRPRSWFDITATPALPDIFEGFWQEYRNNAEELARVIRWYAYSNETDVADVSMIFNQVALETFSHSTVGAKSSKPTGEWIADALQHVGIDTQIPAFCVELNTLANRNCWKHGPHALVEIRNDMVHSNMKHTNIPIDAYHEARHLGLWYLELMFLQRFGYMDKYANRLTPVQKAGATEAVPWK